MSAECLTVVDMRLPARPTELRRARDCVGAAAAELGLDAKARYEFVFAVNEAVTNAIKHGSPDEDGAIGLRIEADDETLLCTVTDCGPFVPPTAEAEASDESGRGFAFMTKLTDDFELLVEPESTTVRLCKRRSSGEVQGA